jgi:ComF family protein
MTDATSAREERAKPDILARLALDGVLGLVYPPRCLLCGDHTGDQVCASCLDSVIVPIPEPFCPTCGHPRKGVPCLACKSDPPDFEAARAVSLYAGEIQDLIRALKYHDKPQLAVPLGRLLAQHVHDVRYALGDLEFDVVTAVPMHRRRKRERGYNQAERLASVFASEMKLPYDANVLARAHYTRPQVGLKHDDRVRNVSAAFRAGATPVLGKTILVIDDVSTTSATLKGCATALKAAGARAVYGLTLAAG